MSHSLHAHTPLVRALDGRGLTLREIAWRRVQDEEEPQALTKRMAYDSAGRLTALWDPRLWALAEQDAASPANRRHHYNLAGIPLSSKSVDAGEDLALLAEAGNVIQSWDSRGSSWQTRYDPYLRPVATVEIDDRHNSRTITRLIYADNSDASAEHNQCGQLARLDDTAGTLHFADYGVLGQVLTQSRQFLKTPELPDWTETTDYLDLVESEAFITQRQYNTTGEPTFQTDARGNAQRFSYSVAGDLSGVYLRLNAQNETPLVDRISYNAFGQAQEQTAGNGVVTRSVYEASSGLLQSVTADPLQSLHYRYDPVGNILQIEDSAQPVRFFANQQVEPISHYRYDTLYQLIEATGREVSSGTSHGPALPDLQPLPPDPNQVSNYTQSYDYDSAGNLLQMRHVGAQPFTRTLRVAPDSNRSLPEGETDTDFATGFDANGNLLQLIRGQTLEWDLRNQLQQITTVTRATTASDQERYIYNALGQRCRKISSTQTASRTLINEVRYLPGLEIRTSADGEVLHVITAHNSRVLHWQAGLPSGIANDQIRYSLTDQLGSSTLELDQQGGLISQESYYPFGGTSWWAARSAVEAKYKTVRYSGKERDASGLYYYGFRYYAPWLQRWINPDPSGDIDGLNLYLMVSNNPIGLIDRDGRMESSAIQKDLKEAKNLLLHNILIHTLVLDMTEERVTAARLQIYNYLDPAERKRSIAKRSSSLLAEAAAKLGGAIGGGAALGAVVGAITGGPIGVAVGGIAGGVVGSQAAGYATEATAEKLELTTAINLKVSALNPYKIFHEASATANSLYDKALFKIREKTNIYDRQVRKKAMQAAVSSALGFIPLVGKPLKSAPQVAELGYEIYKSDQDISVDKWQHLDSNLDSLEWALEDNLLNLKALFENAGITEIKVSRIPTVHKESLATLKQATENVIGLIANTREWSIEARKTGRRGSQFMITHL
ncbi:RHS repeat domain-containing protein [Pseudomonas capsici]|uniref:RHS repeat domain-containing protein n=1 Tax=Pseudomonas capsici TaxID=2810614 RepID=UPI0021F1336C|nr:RHS repeat-associated core domain-containing protein [Pseudomonas capsici]MCV4281376.1 insecticidal toxin complex protein C1 [Pseudomonas capsici]